MSSLTPPNHQTKPTSSEPSEQTTSSETSEHNRVPPPDHRCGSIACRDSHLPTLAEAKAAFAQPDGLTMLYDAASIGTRQQIAKAIPVGDVVLGVTYLELRAGVVNTANPEEKFNKLLEFVDRIYATVLGQKTVLKLHHVMLNALQPALTPCAPPGPSYNVVAVGGSYRSGPDHNPIWITNVIDSDGITHPGPPASTKKASLDLAHALIPEVIRYTTGPTNVDYQRRGDYERPPQQTGPHQTVTTYHKPLPINMYHMAILNAIVCYAGAAIALDELEALLVAESEVASYGSVGARSGAGVAGALSGLGVNGARVARSAGGPWISTANKLRAAADWARRNPAKAATVIATGVEVAGVSSAALRRVMDGPHIRPPVKFDGVKPPARPSVADPLPGVVNPAMEARMQKQSGRISQINGNNGSWTNTDDVRKGARGGRGRGGSRAPSRGGRRRGGGGVTVNVGNNQSRRRAPRANAGTKLASRETVVAKQLAAAMFDPSDKIPPQLGGTSGGTTQGFGWRKLALTAGVNPYIVIQCCPLMFQSGNYSPLAVSVSTVSNAAGTITAVPFYNNGSLYNLVNSGSAIMISRSRCVAINFTVNMTCDGNARMASVYSGFMVPSNTTSTSPVGDPTNIPVLLPFDTILNSPGMKRVPNNVAASISWVPNEARELDMNSSVSNPTPAAWPVTNYPTIILSGCPASCTIDVDCCAWFEAEENTNNASYGAAKPQKRIDTEAMFALLPTRAHPSLRGTLVHNSRFRTATTTSVATVRADPIVELRAEIESLKRGLREASFDEKHSSECYHCRVTTPSPGLCESCSIALHQVRNTVENNGVTSVESTPEHITRKLDALKFQLTGKVPPVDDLIRHGLGPTNKEMHALNGNGSTATGIANLTTTKADKEPEPPPPPPLGSTRVVEQTLTIDAESLVSDADDAIMRTTLPIPPGVPMNAKRGLPEIKTQTTYAQVVQKPDKVCPVHRREFYTGIGCLLCIKKAKALENMENEIDSGPPQTRTKPTGQARPSSARTAEIKEIIVEKVRMINRKGQTKHVKSNFKRTVAKAVDAAKEQAYVPKKQQEPKVSCKPASEPPASAPPSAIPVSTVTDLLEKELAECEARTALVEQQIKLRRAADKVSSAGVHTMVETCHTVIDNNLTRSIGVGFVEMTLDTRPYNKYTRDEFGVTTVGQMSYDYKPMLGPLQIDGCYSIVVPSTLWTELEIDALALIGTVATRDETPEELKARSIIEKSAYNVLVARCTRKLKQIGNATPEIMRDALTWLPRLAWASTYRVLQVTNPFNTLPFAYASVPKTSTLFDGPGYKRMECDNPEYLPSMDQVEPDHCTCLQTVRRNFNLLCYSDHNKVLGNLRSFGVKPNVDHFMQTERIIHGLKPDRKRRLNMAPIQLYFPQYGPKQRPIDPDVSMYGDFKNPLRMFRDSPKDQQMPPADKPAQPHKRQETARSTKSSFAFNPSVDSIYGKNCTVIAPIRKQSTWRGLLAKWYAKRKVINAPFNLQEPLLSSTYEPHARDLTEQGVEPNPGPALPPYTGWATYPFSDWTPSKRMAVKRKSGYHYPHEVRPRRTPGRQHAYAFNHPYRPVCYDNTMENEEATMMTRVVVETPVAKPTVLAEFIAYCKKNFHAYMNHKVKKVKPVSWEVYLERSNASVSVKKVLSATMAEMLADGFHPDDVLTPDKLKKWTTRSLFLKKENLCYRSPLGEKDKAARAISSVDPHFICATGPFHMAQQDAWKRIWSEDNWLCFVSGVDSKAAANVINMPWMHVEDDVGMFDSSVHEQMLLLEVWVTKQFGAPRTVVDLGRANVKTHGTTFHGAKYWAFGGRKSGDPFTSLYNSYLNAMMHAFIIHKSTGWSVQTIKRRVRMLVAGDDNVMAINHSEKIDFVSAMLDLGFNSEALYRDDIFSVEFCSCRVYEIGDNLFFGPMPGKVLSKLGFINTPPVDVSRESLLRGVALGLQTLCNYIPPIKTFVDRILQLTQGNQAYHGPEAQFKGMAWQMDFASYDHTYNSQVMTSLFETYGWTPNHQASLDTSVSTLNLDEVIVHPGFLMLCDRDTSAPAA